MFRRYATVLVAASLGLTAIQCKAHVEAKPNTAKAAPAQNGASGTDAGVSAAAPKKAVDGFEFVAETFADLRILRYQVPGFGELPAKQKELVYYLYEAALSGRDILWDQHHEHGLLIRRTLEAIDATYAGDKTTDEWKAFSEYLKRVWFSYGIHHHYSKAKFVPGFSKESFAKLVKGVPADKLPLAKGQTPDKLTALLTPVLFDPKVVPQRVNMDPKTDMVLTSSTNYYGSDLKQKEVEAFYKKAKAKKNDKPVMHGLNSKLVRGKRGKLAEKVWKSGGMYGPAIDKIVFWLEKAVAVAENDAQKKTLNKLVAYYKSGKLADFDAYNIAWVNDVASRVDTINGFIESYGDPLDMRGSFEALVSFKDMEATKRIEAISKAAQWFEDNSAIADAHKKKDVKGISAKVITVVAGSGDASPSSPLGINLPNSDWIRKDHGSKSVNLGNIAHAYAEASKTSGVFAEFSGDDAIVKREKLHGHLADNLHTDLHEVIGHASGKLNPGIGSASATLKNYAGVLEEARADLVALYFLLDKKLIELGVMTTLDVGKAAYDGYIINGLMVQQARVKLGDDLQQAHMRNRQMVCKWVMEKGKTDKVIERVERAGKTYFYVRDYQKLRVLFGKLMAELQRIKSEGDYKAGKALVEGYGVKIDQAVHKQVLERYKKLGVKPYSGFINPRLVPVKDASGAITDVTLSYPADFSDQMREYAAKYTLLPTAN